MRSYSAPRNVVATFTQSVTRWHFRKAKFVQSCNIQFLNFFKRGFPNNFYPTKICRDVVRRVQLCIEHNGGQFEHFQ
jgi:hypothetical protein